MFNKHDFYWQTQEIPSTQESQSARIFLCSSVRSNLSKSSFRLKRMAVFLMTKGIFILAFIFNKWHLFIQLFAFTKKRAE
jgi:hypothetical protein